MTFYFAFSLKPCSFLNYFVRCIFNICRSTNVESARSHQAFVHCWVLSCCHERILLSINSASVEPLLFPRWMFSFIFYISHRRVHFLSSYIPLLISTFYSISISTYFKLNRSFFACLHSFMALFPTFLLLGREFSFFCYCSFNEGLSGCWMGML